MSDAVIVDVDGTLCDVSSVRHLVQRENEQLSRPAEPGRRWCVGRDGNSVLDVRKAEALRAVTDLRDRAGELASIAVCPDLSVRGKHVVDQLYALVKLTHDSQTARSTAAFLLVAVELHQELADAVDTGHVRSR